MAFPPEMQWDDSGGQAMCLSQPTLNSSFLKYSPAEGITAARNKRDSACPADGSVSRLHHIRGRDHGSFWPIATLPQEFMSAMPPKADEPEPTRMTQIGHLDIYQPVGGLPVKTAN